MPEKISTLLEQATNRNMQLQNISRRSFLKGALAIGGALALTGCTRGTTPDPTTAPTTAPATGAPTVPTTPVDNMVKVKSFIMPDYSHCVGCGNCEIYCSVSHYGEVNVYNSNIQLHSINIKGAIIDVPHLCVKCFEAPCVAACPPAIAAITQDETTGAMLINKQTCILCGLCITACEEERGGVLRLSRDGNDIVGMCDMCGGNPECVINCPEDCLRIVPIARGENNGWGIKPREMAQRVFTMLYDTPYEI